LRRLLVITIKWSKIMKNKGKKKKKEKKDRGGKISKKKLKDTRRKKPSSQRNGRGFILERVFNLMPL